MTFTIEEENILCIFRDEHTATSVPIKDLIVEAISYATDSEMRSLLTSVLRKLRSDRFDPAILDELVPVYSEITEE